MDSFSSMTEQIGRHRRDYLRWLALLCFATSFLFVLLHFFVWHVYVAGIACVIYLPVCVFVIWGTYQHEKSLEFFVHVMVVATILLMLVTISFQQAAVVTDHWILAGTTLGFVLCRRQVAAVLAILSLIGLFGIRQYMQYPSALGSTVSLALAIGAISIGLYLYSRHIDKVERFIVEAGNIDSLTGTLNRRSLQQVLQAEFRRNLRHQVSMTVFMIDADHFKAYNDRYGHISGDSVLIRIAEVLKRLARRPSDYVFRYGGEEFCILCSGMDAAQAATLAATLCANIESLALTHEASPMTRITVSVGYRHAESLSRLTPEQLLDEADKALYLAKANGRNRVESYLSAAAA